MSKLTKAQAKAHAEAEAILGKDVLTEDDKWFVLEHWREDARHMNGTAGAFFTPPGLARDLCIEVGGVSSIVDLCAGIGTLAFMAQARMGPSPRLVCVERNPDYVAVGRKIVPEATWVCADVFDAAQLAALGRFDMALSNPPFGATPRTGSGPNYRGRAFEYHVIDVASGMATYGAFIVPQGSAPFRLSGQRGLTETSPDEYRRFLEATGIELAPGCGVDCDFYRDQWHGVAPTVEIVCTDFTERATTGLPLFEGVAP